MNDLRIIAAKAALRKAVFQRRAAAHAEGAARALAASERLVALLDRFRAVDGVARVAGYRPIRTEIDPLCALEALHGRGSPLAMPVVEGAGQPLSFRPWHPGAAEVEGAFGAPIPADTTAVTPQVLIVPLVAFDPSCRRLGYGGGFYDRTLEGLRAKTRATLAIGFAYAAQQVDEVPYEGTDQVLDAVVTESGILQPVRSGAGG
ncbi:MAG: 5-formyltetrahydrofolate cyclo-ligase [Pseudomonadota bacterium]